jgi:hypothetical protein
VYVTYIAFCGVLNYAALLAGSAVGLSVGNRIGAVVVTEPGLDRCSSGAISLST